MIQHEKQVKLCELYIQFFTSERSAINKVTSSYGYKHFVERLFQTYISNDAFKEAAKNMRLWAKPADNKGINEFYNISTKIDHHNYHNFPFKYAMELVSSADEYSPSNRPDEEISNMTGKIMMSVRLQIDYNNYRGECKEIEFLKVK